MRKYLLIMLVLVAAALVVTGCAAPVPPTPAPTPRPTTAPTSVPPPTVMPPTATTAPTMTPTTIPTPAATATLAAPTMTPTRTRVPATSAPRATVTPTRAPAPKGNLLYHRNDSGRDYLRVLNLETNITTELVDTGPVMDLALGTNAHLGEFSPDNTRFAYIFAGSPGVANVLRVLDLRTGDTRALFSSEPAPGSGLSSPSWSPDGTRIAFIWMRSNQSFWAVGVINADGTNRKDLRVNPGGESYRGGISWSKQNVLAIAQNVGAPSEIFTLFTDGGGLTNRSNNPADDSTPVWSPDGKQLAFTSNRDGRQQIYVMNADGSGVRRVSQSSTNDHSPSWSPDGNWIAFASFREGGTDVYMMDLRGGNVKRLTTAGGDHPVWSK